MADHSIHVVERYAHRLQMSPETQILGLLGFLAQFQTSGDPAAATDQFFDFLKAIRFEESQGVLVLCQLVDNNFQDGAFLKFFEEYAVSYGDMMRLPAPLPSPSPAPVPSTCSNRFSGGAN